MKNLSEIKNELIQKGLMYQDHAEKANQQLILITGEWTRDNKISNLKKLQGLSGEGIIPKYVNDDYEIPTLIQSDDLDEVEERFKKDLMTMYPNHRVGIRID